MFNNYFGLFLLGHIVGDFYIQFNKMAEKKKKKISWILIHSASYLGTMILVIIPVISWKLILIAIILGILHLITDLGKHFLTLAIDKREKMTYKIDRNLFFIDQGLHLICIILVAYIIIVWDIAIGGPKWFSSFFNIINISESQVLSWFLAILIIHKPSNIGIQKLLMIYRPENKKEDTKKNSSVGSLIGTIERIVILIFFGIKQYSAIGLILTAKSIARYDKITKEKNFAEYYLLGTLISALVGIVVSLMIIG